MKGDAQSMPWKTGVSGNPKGRPKRTQIEKLEIEQFKNKLKEYSVDALETIYNFMFSEKVDFATRYKCAAYILDKTYGKTFVAIDEVDEQDRTIIIHVNSVGEEYKMTEDDEREIKKIGKNLEI